MDDAFQRAAAQQQLVVQLLDASIPEEQTNNDLLTIVNSVLANHHEASFHLGISRHSQATKSARSESQQ